MARADCRAATQDEFQRRSECYGMNEHELARAREYCDQLTEDTLNTPLKR
jgi:hypothetical protein